jgi:hypothetical protein
VKLDQIRALCDAATPGPWKCVDQQVFVPCHKRGKDIGIFEWNVTCDGKAAPTAQFIAACRELVPKLLTVAEADRAYLAASGDVSAEHTALEQALSALQKPEDR